LGIGEAGYNTRDACAGMNVLERAECLLDCGSSGNMNFTVIAAFRGQLEIRVLEAALMALQRRHTLLRSSLS